MWEESLIESQHAASGHRKFLTFPAAVVIHTAVILGLAASNYAEIETVNPTRIIPIFWKGDPPPKGVPEGIRRESPRRTQQTEARETRPSVTVPVPLADNISLEPQQQVTEGQQGNGSGEGEKFGIPEGIDGSQGDWGSGSNEGTQLKESGPYIIDHTGITPPVLTRKVEPEYPRLLRISRVEGYVILKAVITKEGDVQILSVTRSDHPLLEKVTLKAVRQWKYRPALLNNRPVAVYFQITVKFTLK